MSFGSAGDVQPKQTSASKKKTTTNVATSSVLIAAANAVRAGFVVFNNSSNSCYVSWDNPANASECVRIIPTFTSWECYGPILYTGAMFCIRNAGTGAVTVWEINT